MLVLGSVGELEQLHVPEVDSLEDLRNSLRSHSDLASGCNRGDGDLGAIEQSGQVVGINLLLCHLEHARDVLVLGLLGTDSLDTRDATLIEEGYIGVAEKLL